MKYLTLLLVILILFSITLAQQQVLPQQRRVFMSEEVQYLIRLLRDLTQLDKDKKTVITKAQAQKLISILQELGKVNLLPKKDADKFIERIEGVLTDAQITYLDKMEIERQKRLQEMRQRIQQGTRQETQRGQQPPQMPSQQPPQWRGRQGQEISEKERQQFQKFMEAWSKGQPLNPFYHLDIYKKMLNDLIESLKKK
ncbi:MAG: hypothetical protein N2312_01600 [Dictyoglomaceae bacterium]|nr:hypothetical protein [Dictyoglomaceae bacterium]